MERNLTQGKIGKSILLFSSNGVTIAVNKSASISVAILFTPFYQLKIL